MTKLTPKELDERIASLASEWFGEPVLAVENEIKQLIKDCIEAVTPEHIDNWKDVNPKKVGGLASYNKLSIYRKANNQAIDTIQANTSELLS